jgi:tetratricopeptide (TPR) repeat protein/serine/threonine protein kinase
MRMERPKSPLDNENERRQSSAEKSSEHLQKSRHSHLIGSGVNLHDWSNQQVGTDEAREKNAITTPPETDSDHRDNGTGQKSLDLTIHDTSSQRSQDIHSGHSNTQGRNEKRQLSALEEEQQRKWSKSIPLDEYGHRASKTFELTSIPTRDNPILVGGANFFQMIGFRNPERGESSGAGDQRSEVDKWIGQTVGEYCLVKCIREAEDRYGRMRLFYRGERVHPGGIVEVKEVEVPKEAGKLIGQTVGEYRLVDYIGEGGFAYVYRGEHIHSKELREVEVPEEAGKWIGQTVKGCRLVDYLGEAKDKYNRMRLFYRGEHIDSKEIVEVDMPKGAGTWIGQRLGEFRIVDYIGEGGFAYVYRGKHVRKERQVAIKVLRPDRVSETEVKQFRKEAEILKKLRHPHIVCGFESGKTKEGVDYLVMEYAPKGILSDAYKGDRPLPWSLEEVVAMANVLADAFDYLHNDKGILHLDLNPRNVLRGAYEQLLLSDFGLAKKVDDKSAVMGASHGYSPPEQGLLEDRGLLKVATGEIGFSSDLYSIAAMVYEALTRQIPFKLTRPDPETDPETLVGKIQGVPEGRDQTKIQEVLFKALAYYPEDRCYESVKIFAEELEKACFGRIREKRMLRDYEQDLYQKIAMCDKKLRHNPNDVPANLDKGMALYHLDHNRYALESFNKVIENNPRHVEAHYYKGDILYRLNCHTEALEAYNKVIRLIEELANDEYQELANATYIARGNVHRDLKHDVEAEADYNEAISLNEEIIKKYDDKGKGLVRFGFNKKAQKAKVNCCNQQIACAYFNKGEIYYNRNHHQEALEFYKEAVKRDPRDADAQYKKGLLLSEFGNREEAVKALKEAIQFNPEHVDAYCNMGIALAWLGIEHKEEAKAAFGKAIELNPNDAIIRYNNGVILLKFKEYKDAVRAFDEATLIDTKHADAYYHKGLALSMLGDDLKGAEVAFDKAICCNSEDANRCNSKDAANAYYQRGLVRSKLGDNQGAEEDFGEARRLNHPLLVEAPDISSQNVEVERTDHPSESGPEAPSVSDNQRSQAPLPQNIEEIHDFRRQEEVKVDPDEILRHIQSIRNKSAESANNASRRYEAMLLAINAKIHLDPNDASAYVSRGLIRMELRHNEEALEDFEVAIRLRSEKALHLEPESEEALHLKLENAVTYTYKGVVFAALKRYNEALEACNVATNVNSNYADAYDCRGVVLHMGLRRNKEDFEKG